MEPAETSEEPSGSDAPPAEGTTSSEPLPSEKTPKRSSAAMDDWVGPRRIALIVALGISLALFLGTAAALLALSGQLPVAGLLALGAGILEIPVVVLYTTGLERRVVPLAPVLLLASAGGIASYFVGGAVGVASPSTLGAGVLAVVAYFYVGHRRPESIKRRIRRVRRWSRNSAVAGAAFLLAAVALYAAYSGSTALAPVAHVDLEQSTLLNQGQSDVLPAVAASPGDELFFLLGASNTSANITGSFLNSTGAPIASLTVTAGTFSAPNVVFFPLLSGGGAFRVELTVPAAPYGVEPSGIEVRWTLGDIPASTVALGASAVPAGWGGFIMLVVGITLWIVSRPPPQLIQVDTPPAETPSSSERGAEAPSEGTGEDPPASSAKDEGSSDDGTTTAPESDDRTSSTTSK